MFGYYFSSKKTILFNPAAVLMLGIKFKRIENETKQLLADTNNMHWAIGVINRVHAYKNIGITFGIVLDTWNFHDFNENNELYLVESGFNFSPILTIDITIPSPKKKD